MMKGIERKMIKIWGLRHLIGYLLIVIVWNGVREHYYKDDPAGLFMAQFQTRTDENYTRIPSDR